MFVPAPKSLIAVANWQVGILNNAFLAKDINVPTRVIRDAVAQLHGHENWRAWMEESQDYLAPKRNLSHRLDRELPIIHKPTAEHFKKRDRARRIARDDDTDASDPR